MEKLVFNRDDKKIYHLSGFSCIDVKTNEKIVDLDFVFNLNDTQLKPCKYISSIEVDLSTMYLNEAIERIENCFSKNIFVEKLIWEKASFFKLVKLKILLKGTSNIYIYGKFSKFKGNYSIILTSKIPLDVFSYILKKTLKCIY